MTPGHLPMPLLVVVFGRDALLMAGSFLKRASERPEGSAFFDTTSSATFQITPNLLSKVGLWGGGGLTGRCDCPVRRLNDAMTD